MLPNADRPRHGHLTPRCRVRVGLAGEPGQPTAMVRSTGTHTFTVDEPAKLGGGGTAPNPVQYALASLGSCQAITYRFWAEQLGISLGTLTVRVEGDLDIRGFFGFGDGVRPGLSAVRVQVGITGPDTPQRYQELAAAVDEHCPVLDLFRNPVPVDRTIAVG